MKKIALFLLWAALVAPLLVAGPPPRGPGFNPHILFGTVERVREAQKAPTPPPTAPTPVPAIEPAPAAPVNRESFVPMGVIFLLFGGIGFCLSVAWHFGGGVPIPRDEENEAGTATISAVLVMLGFFALGQEWPKLNNAGFIFLAVSVLMCLEWLRCRR